MAIDDFPFHAVKNPGTITASTVGLAYAPTLDGLGLASADDSSGPWLSHSTEPINGKAAGMITTFDVLAGLWLPQAEFVVRTPQNVADLANARYWVGLFAELPDGQTAGTTSLLFAGFNFEGGVSGNAPWVGAVSNGVTNDDVTAAGNVAAGTTYTLKIVVQSARVVFLINGTSLTQVDLVPVSPSPPPTPELLGLGIRVTATAGVSRSILWRRASWRYS